MRNAIVAGALALSCLSGAVQAGTISVSGSGGNRCGTVITSDSIKVGQAGEIDINSSKPIIELAGEIGTTLFEDVGFIHGQDGIVNKLGNVEAGNYRLTLTDFQFPNLFEELRVALTTATQVVSMLIMEDGQTQTSALIALNGTDTYYLSVFGDTGAVGNYGLYGVKLALSSYSPVPLPAPVFLLLSGLLAWGATGFKRSKNAV